MPDQFETEYAKLNPEQKKAVDAIEGPVMVIAGPGTGKTQILTLRIANILRRTDTPPDAILALTFTEAAAANMRRRLTDLVGGRGYYVSISTFHGFANRLIREHPDQFPAVVGGESATPVEQAAILREILDQDEFEILRPFGDRYFYVPDMLAAIQHLKREGFLAETFRELADKEHAEFESIPDKYHTQGAHRGKMKGVYREQLADLEKNLELARVYAAYAGVMAERHLYDFDDMILFAADALAQDENFLLMVQERCQYILVDEHQDTNGAQNRLLELLASFFANPNLFTVGDEKQAIYRFQGASLENFLRFKEKYPEALLINLQANYRSGQGILDAAQTLIEHNRATLASGLTAQKSNPVILRAAGFESTAAEHDFTAQAIQAETSAGNPAEEIAVLYRDNRDAGPIAEALARRGVPHVIESDEDILHDPDIRKIILLLRAIENFGADEALARALHIDFLGLDPLDIYLLLGARERRSASLHRLLDSTEKLADLGLTAPEKAAAFYRRLKNWKVQSRNRGFLEFLAAFLREAGVLGDLLQKMDLDALQRINLFFGEAKRMTGGRADYDLAEFLNHLEIFAAHRLSLKKKSRPRSGYVRLMTAHRAKGLEFDTVFVNGLADGHWGNRRVYNRFRRLPFRSQVQPGELERNEDERRLFYMALTRARRAVFLTYALRTADGRELVPSQFLEEAGLTLPAASAEAGLSSGVVSATDQSSVVSEAKIAPAGQAEYLREIFLSGGFTATMLNNYLDCPWKFFYENLLRLPQAYNQNQAYGSAVHRALQEFFSRRGKGEMVDLECLTRSFEAAIKKYPLRQEERAAALQKGRKNLPLYYRRYVQDWTYRTASEVKIDGVNLDGIRLHGKLDKLELAADGRTAVVVDYKTGQPQSRNRIEGKTKGANGNYKRQLVFYKLLLDGDPDQRFKMAAGELDFVEPTDQGSFRKERFEITAAEAAEVAELIRQTHAEIKSMAFWEKHCADKDCEYCALRALMEPGAAKTAAA